MTIYKGLIRGEDAPRYVKAASKKAAQDHFVSLSALTADEVEELIGGDAKIERVGEQTKPEPNGDAEAE